MLNRSQGENSRRWPVFLPDGVHFLYSFGRASTSDEACMLDVDLVAGKPDIWIEDLTRGTRVRVTTDADRDIFPVISTARSLRSSRDIDWDATRQKTVR